MYSMFFFTISLTTVLLQFERLCLSLCLYLLPVCVTVNTFTHLHHAFISAATLSLPRLFPCILLHMTWGPWREKDKDI